ncbi:hypothetical protein GCM10023143_19270 [Compostibacter hankyongensis]|uniref:Uncharacterized protein n=1 Tax=Compostibacter hankyongensis TaxID=1007089 RepID=A0ABP8FTK1_9BACT
MDFFIRIDKAEGQLNLAFLQDSIQAIFPEAVGLAGKPLYAVAVYCPSVVFFGNAETNLGGCSSIGKDGDVVNDTIGENRKRFPFPKKRFNTFFAF